MKELHDKFIEDVTDTIFNLEKDLLELEKNPKEKQYIDKVFRVMHSLKGVSAMYGFEKIGEFTHLLETVYDLIRCGKVDLNRQILDITFASIDLISNMLQDKDLELQTNKDLHHNLCQGILVIIKDIEEGSDVEKVESKTQTSIEGIKTYYLWFTPCDDMFVRGVSIDAIFGEIKALATYKTFVYSEKIPDYKNLDPIRCFWQWEIYIVTEKSKEEVEDIFIFVEDEYKIKHIYEGNLFIDKKFHDISTKNTKNFRKEFLQVHEPVVKEEAKIEKPTTDTKINALFQEHKTQSIRVDSLKLDELMNLVSELVTTKAELTLIAEQSNIPRLTSVAEKMEKLSRQLRDNALVIRLVPIDTIMVQFKRLVRDLANDLKKEVEFIIEGTETELDKTIIDNLSNPLMHILRNSIDHGIETPEERVKKGKRPVGIIKFIAFYSGTNVFIQIQDDGKGINLSRILEKAIEKGFATPQAHLSDKEILSFIFYPGFSTAENVSEVSGRGVGMDIVKQRISEIRGDVDVDTELNLGTTITIKLPLTLSIIDALWVKIGEINLLVPLSVVDFCSEENSEVIQNATNGRLIIGDELIPLIYLRKEFKIEGQAPDIERIVVIHFDDKTVGLVVDMVVGEHQAVLKPLGELFRRQDIISGASILGDGAVALVLDTNKLIEQFLQKKLF